LGENRNRPGAPSRYYCFSLAREQLYYNTLFDRAGRSSLEKKIIDKSYIVLFQDFIPLNIMQAVQLILKFN